jgi:hypothetical protein
MQQHLWVSCNVGHQLRIGERAIMHQPAFRKTVPLKEVTQTIPEFSLVLGGPLYQFYLRTKLAKLPIDLVPRRIIALSLTCWLPPLALSLFSGIAFGRVKVPFLLDLGAHLRFLCALPLLIAAEQVVQRRIPNIVRQFFDRNIIANGDRARFQGLISSVMRARNSALVEMVLLVLAFAGFWMWQEYPRLGGSTWYVVETNGKMRFTPAGYWYVLISLPLLRFILFRWYFRLALWYRFLWSVQRFKLHLNFLHPDLAGGLGFLSGSTTAFSPFLVAQTVIVAGIIADEIRYGGMTLLGFKMEIVAILLFLLLAVFTPLCFFMAQLGKAGRAAKRKYGTFASHYVDDFWSKWIAKDGTRTEKQPLGTADIQSLADLAASYAVVSKMRIVPFGKSAVMRIAILTCIPLLPLTLTMIPLDQVIDRLAKFVL